MPLYDYDCLACGRRIEVIHGVHAPGPTHCPNCGSGPLKKAISAPAVHFRGSGWAKRDRRATVTAGAAKAAGDSEPSGEGTKPDKEDAKPSLDTKRADGASGGDSGTTTKPADAGAASTTAGA
jgi:putative FmdB family regulatory protein